jgi:hypothetical protein
VVLNHDSYTIQLPYTVGADWAGQNIVSNPYPAAIDIKELIFGSETESSVYQYNTGSLKEWQDNLAVQTPGTQPGTYIVSTKQTAGILQIPRRIPSMQGFLVNALSNSSNATLEIPYSAVRMPNVESQRAPRSVAAETTVATQIDLVSAHSSDQLWLISEPTCTRNFDKGWDGYKFIAPASIAQIYASEVDGDYQIDVLNDVNDTYISLQAGVDTNFKLVFTHQNLGLKYNQLFLLDLLTNQTTDITLSGAEVSFIAQPTPSQTKRFKILTSRASATIDDAYNNADLKVFCSKGKIVIQNMSSDGGSVDIYNVSGVQLSTKQFGAYERVELLDVITGVYLVKAKTQNCDTKQKVIVP